MKKLCWLTDIHLDSTGDTDHGTVQLCAKVRQSGAEAVLLTGDISTSVHIVHHLSVMDRELQMPIYFVCGNHDYYRGSIDDVRRQLKELTNISPFLRYMPLTPYVPLTSTTALVGHDGWYDCLYGDTGQTDFIMNDWRLIREFAVDFLRPPSGWYQGSSDSAFTSKIVKTAQRLAHEGTTHIAVGIKAAARRYKHVVVLTHFPPFAEAARYKDGQTEAGHLPWYASKMMGDMLLQAAGAFPQTRFTVFCGHTHGEWRGQIKPNLAVHVGAADYGSPVVQPTVEVE